ncbi:MAG: enoyl-CoA hydratase-related protein [Salinisphaera sp.]|jgi:enoyl-CoA hydratase/carnithine racemase|nr:enoyl-CoA hydratase-related protein [Salinisphaera sp.]
MTTPEMQSGYIRLNQQSRVLRLTLDRADKRNALTGAMYKDLQHAVQYAAEADDIYVVLIDAAGDMFCAGNDINDFASRDSHASDEGTAGPALSFIRDLAHCDKPVVVAVQGQATGIGTTLLLHTDLVVAADDARFFTAFIDLGLVPEAGSSLLLPALIGRQNAARLLLAGDTFDAAEAERMGLIAYRVPRNQLAQTADELARRLADKSRAALCYSKQLMREGVGRAVVEAQMEREAQLFGERLASEEVQRIMQRFLKRGK